MTKSNPDQSINKPSSEQPIIGISQCLLGEKVRHDGGHKRSQICTQLSQHVHYQAHCPEMAIGLGTPRKPIRLVEKNNTLRLCDTKDNAIDHTDKMLDYVEQIKPKISELSGFIFCKDSPSCGIERVKRYSEQSHLLGKDATGLFANGVIQANPILPIEDSGRLNDAHLKENFINRVFTYFEAKKMLNQEELSAQELIAFYSRYKYMVMAHHIASYEAIGQLLANLKNKSIIDVAEKLVGLLMQALQHQATRKTHSNVLNHLQGYLKNSLSATDKSELVHTINQYREGIIPLITPITLIRHHFKNHPDPYILQQIYLTPYPENIGLRSAI